MKYNTMTVLELYSRYTIPPNLIRHHLEVTAVGRFLTKHWIGNPVDTALVTHVLLLHDMGNIIKFRRPFLGELEKDALYWQKVQDEYIARYGNSVHPATLAIARELGVSESVYATLAMLDGSKLLEFGYTSDELRICSFADLCVTPEGIVGYAKRSKDLDTRYGIENQRKYTKLRDENFAYIQERCAKNLSHIHTHDFAQEITKLRSYNTLFFYE